MWNLWVQHKPSIKQVASEFIQVAQKLIEGKTMDREQTFDLILFSLEASK